MSMAWLTERRLKAYPPIFLGVYVATIVFWLWRLHSQPTEGLKPIGYDFVAFWSAAKLAALGWPAQAYEVAAIHALQQQVIGAVATAPVAWFYPPSFLLLVFPVGALPYAWASALWLSLGLLIYIGFWRHVAPHPLAAGLAVAFPGAFINLVNGQNGFITTILVGAGLLLIDRRPILAGLCLGALSFKPQLALLVPVALLAGGYWRVLASAAGSACALAFASLALFGPETWASYLASTDFVWRVLENGMVPWNKMPTFFVAARLLGAAAATAYLLQIAAGLAAALFVAWVWRTEQPVELRRSVLVIAAFAATPYAFDYDLVLLSLPLAWLAMFAIRRGFEPGEKMILLCAWLAPFLLTAIAWATRVQLGPLLFVALFWVIWRRARLAAGEGSTIAPKPVLSPHQRPA